MRATVNPVERCETCVLWDRVAELCGDMNTFMCLRLRCGTLMRGRGDAVGPAVRGGSPVGASTAAGAAACSPTPSPFTVSSWAAAPPAAAGGNPQLRPRQPAPKPAQRRELQGVARISDSSVRAKRSSVDEQECFRTPRSVLVKAVPLIHLLFLRKHKARSDKSLTDTIMECKLPRPYCPEPFHTALGHKYY